MCDILEVYLKERRCARKTSIIHIMKILVISDIHGSVLDLECVLEREKFDKLFILGDLYYHGPRNNLPEGYNPMETAKLLNSTLITTLSITTTESSRHIPILNSSVERQPLTDSPINRRTR